MNFLSAVIVIQLLGLQVYIRAGNIYLLLACLIWLIDHATDKVAQWGRA